MTKTILLLATLLVLPSAFAQVQLTSGTVTVSPNKTIPELTKFNLDFPGGTPKQLVAAIEKAMGKPLNAIISPENADVKLPPLRMKDVNVQQLFTALERISLKQEAIPSGNSYSIFRYVHGFKTEGPLSDESIWYFWVEPSPVRPPAQASRKVCRYFSLAPYLDRGQTVDDITTAIQTGWKMLGDDEIPKISFHKETKLLIAVGDPGKLETIDAVLQALKTQPVPKNIDPATGLPLPSDGQAPSPKPK